MRPIITFTGNLLAERTLDFPQGWQTGRTQRAAAESFQVGGKGFNVAKMLHRLGGRVSAVGFAGGPAGEECRAWLREHAAYEHQLFATTAPTRTGTVVRSSEQAETTWLAPDRAPDAAAFAACAAWLAARDAPTLLAVCGSIPGWSSPAAAPLRDVFGRFASEGRLVVDTYGPPLVDLLQLPVPLVKINADEFRALWSDSDEGAPEALPRRLVEALDRWPVQAWIVSDGPHPVWLQTCGQSRSFAPPRVVEVSATGSGDVLLAGLLHRWCNQGHDLAAAVAWSLPLAAANAASAGVADFPLPAGT